MTIRRRRQAQDQRDDHSSRRTQTGPKAPTTRTRRALEAAFSAVRRRGLWRRATFEKLGGSTRTSSDLEDVTWKRATLARGRRPRNGGDRLSLGAVQRAEHDSKDAVEMESRETKSGYGEVGAGVSFGRPPEALLVDKRRLIIHSSRGPAPFFVGTVAGNSRRRGSSRRKKK